MRVSEKNFYSNTALTSITEQDWEELMSNIDSCMENTKDIFESNNNEESLESIVYNKIYSAIHKNENKEH